MIVCSEAVSNQIATSYHHYKLLEPSSFNNYGFLPPAYVVRREGNSFTLLVCPHLGGGVSPAGGGSVQLGGGSVQPGGSVQLGGGSVQLGGRSAGRGQSSRGGGSVSWGGGQVSQLGGSAKIGQQNEYSLHGMNELTVSRKICWPTSICLVELSSVLAFIFTARICSTTGR